MKKKKRMKELGPDRPNLELNQQSSDREQAYTCYGKWSCLAGFDKS